MGKREAVRVLRIADTPRRLPGGVRFYMLHTGAALESMGHEVTYLWKEDLLPRVSNGRLRRLLLPWWIALLGFRQRRRWDVVEVHEPLGAVYGLCRVLLGRRGLPPLALLSFGLEGRHWAARRERARHIRRPISLKSRISAPLTVVSQATVAAMTADVVIVPSSADASHLIDRLRVPRRRVVMAPTGVDGAFLNGTEASSADGTVGIIFVGTWIDRKGTPELSAAWNALSEDPRLRLTLAGTSVSAEDVLGSLPLDHRDRVTVIPNISQEDLRARLSDSDIFVLPSWFEGMPLSLLEAAASGLPCIVSSVCGSRDVFPDSRAEEYGAITVPPHRSDALTHALAALIGDPERRAELGRRARERASLFTWQASAEQIASGYAKARGLAA
jgi:glycosyltransferase involved in cell wall biosynthesis